MPTVPEPTMRGAAAGAAIEMVIGVWARTALGAMTDTIVAIAQKTEVLGGRWCISVEVSARKASSSRRFGGALADAPHGLVVDASRQERARTHDRGELPRKGDHRGARFDSCDDGLHRLIDVDEKWH